MQIIQDMSNSPIITEEITKECININKLIISTIIIICVMCCVVTVDQFAKTYLQDYLLTQKEFSHNIIPHLKFSLAYNTGVAFGIMSKLGSTIANTNISYLLLINIIIIISAYTTFLIHAIKSTIIRKIYCEKKIICLLILILSGAISNIVDRIKIGAVVDFIEIYWSNELYFPIFNFSDMMIVIAGSGLFYFFNKTLSLKHSCN